MTTLVYSKYKVYSDTLVKSENINEQSVEELRRKLEIAVLNGDTFNSILLEAQLNNPFLGEHGTSTWAKSHGKFYWFKGEHYFGEHRLIAGGVAGNMMGYSLLLALDTFGTQKEIDIPVEAAIQRARWVEEAGEVTDFECFYVVEDGIIVEDSEGEFFFIKSDERESFVFGSGRAYLKGRGQKGEDFAIENQSVEDFYGTDYTPHEIMEMVEADPDTNNYWVTIAIPTFY